MTRPVPYGRRRRAARAALGACAALAGACGSEVPPTVPPLVFTATPGAVELLAGDSARIAVAGGTGAPVRLLWRSSDPKVVSVDSTGRVRALDVGAAVVEVGVEAMAPAMLAIPVTAIAPCALGVPMGRPELAALTLGVGVTGRPQVVPGACRPGGDSTLVYESADTTIVAIDRATGLPLGRAPGTTTVTVRLRAAPSVRFAVPAQVWARTCSWRLSLAVQPSALTMAPGDSARLAINVTVPPGAPPELPPLPTLVSSDPTVATVSADGTVRALRPGRAVVTVSYTTADGCGPVSQSVAVTVLAP